MSTWQPKRNPKIYGLHIPYDKGYDAWSQRNYPAAEKHSASGYLRRADGSQVDLWITDVSADFALNGETGQSRMLREFFPRSLQDITLTITGNVAGTREYNRLAAFVRETNWLALQTVNQGGSATPTLTFGLYDLTPEGFRGATRNTKGAHRPWLVNGYVKDMQAGATRHEVAPSFSVAFIVTESFMSGNTGLWSDSMAVASQLKSFLQLVSAQEKIYHGTGFTQDPVTALLPRPQTPAQAVQGVVQSTEQGAWSIAAALKALGI